MPEQTESFITPASRLILQIFNILLVLVCVGFIAYRVLNDVPIGNTGLVLIIALGLFLIHLVFQYKNAAKNITIVAYAYTAIMAIAIIWATIE